MKKQLKVNQLKLFSDEAINFTKTITTPKILITSCKKCNNVINAQVVLKNSEVLLNPKYDYQLVDVNSTTNKKGLQINGCTCNKNKKRINKKKQLVRAKAPQHSLHSLQY